jgi:predicted Zn-dependent peptidase
MIGFKTTDIKNKKDLYALDIASIILGNGRTSRLYQSIKEKKHLATSIDASNFAMRDDGIFYVSATFEPKNYEELDKAIVQELHKFASSKVTEEELARAKTLLARSFIYSNESVSSVANAIGYDMTIGGDISYYSDYLADINKITANEIYQAVNKYIKDGRMAISVVLPETTNKNIKPVNNFKVTGQIYLKLPRHAELVSASHNLAIPKQVRDDVSQMVAPDLLHFKPVHTLKSTIKGIEQISLNNGIDLILDKNRNNDIISLSILVKGGDYIDSIPGLSAVLAGTLLKGTTDKSALEIAKELENSGIEISPSSSDNYFEISFKSTKEDFNKAFDILEDVIKNPVFPQEYVGKTKKDIMENIKESRDTPFSVAIENFNSAIYKGHPYGNTAKILEKTVPTIQRKDITKYYGKVFVPQNMVVSVSGNFDKQDIINKFSSFKSGKSPKIININKLHTPLKPNKNNMSLVTEKNTETGWLVVGWPTAGIRNQKDFATLKVISAIMGGGMSSRLFKDLREEQGLAYEVSASYPTNLDVSSFIMYIGTKPDNLSNVKEQFICQMKRIINEPVCLSELENAKSKIIGQYALAMETNSARAHTFGAYEILGKGYKFYFDYPELIKTVSVQDIMDIAKKYLDKPYVLSVIGPKAKVESFNKETQFESKR